MKKYLFALALLCSIHVFGQQVSLVTLDQVCQRIQLGKDTTYVINFWATWCSPCVEELPFFEKLAVQYKSQKLKVLLISVDFKSKLKTSVVPFVKKHGLKNQIFVLNEQDQQEYINRIDSTWSGALPATLIIKNQTRKFFEKEFTYSELVEEYQKVK
ncbi:TlpA disulfide reductase family protein [Paraflavitalea sp. CAU 1676]|uniref:TlpA disulfide reductase family protein n=1 Tax=Paraflavitalea sp. CAU 1676 TaxID=3032598 RepID=UPI0023DA293A|nr:TlpA disulfide reductase family protein [Paraflavitalea sp. CAU 1676]MDF2191316.1 TlpA disulfide reductase family protein [Paraflavitalea sp. CAU 1676]